MITFGMDCNKFCIYGLLFWLILSGCGKENLPYPPDTLLGRTDTSIPEGYFVATFTPAQQIDTKSVNGTDIRIQHIRYILYNTNGQFVKERTLLQPTDGNPLWPLSVLKDTLPRGTYRAVFFGNTEETLFPYLSADSLTHYNEVLQNYQTTYAAGRILLPNAEFTDKTEYYWANVSFSDQNPNPSVLLQRIIGRMDVHRNVLDAQKALDTLVANIVTNLEYNDLLTTTANAILTTKVKAILNPLLGNILLKPIFDLLGGLDPVTNLIVGKLVAPVVKTLYTQLLQQLTHQIGLALAGNEDQQGLLALLGELLNPWELSQAHTAIVYLKDFPKAIDFDLVMQDKYDGIQRFASTFVDDAFFAQKRLHINGFAGTYNIQKIDVIKKGLLAGLLIDQVIDAPLLLNGTFVDITDSLRFTVPANRRYKADYSLVDVGLKSYTVQTDGETPLTLAVRVGDVANVNSLLGTLGLGALLSAILSPIENITVTLPVNLPLLGIDNLTVSGGWSTPTAY